MKRLYTIDIFRIVSAFFVFLFHSRIHLNVNYSVLNPFIEMSHIFMVAFFILSGFSIHYVDIQNIRLNVSDDIRGNKSIGKFIKRRILGIYPLYIATYILFILFYIVGYSMLKDNKFINDYIMQHMNDYSVINNIVILPVELTMLQSVFNGSFSVLHNGGTWFVSCIFICYLVYPFVSEFVTNNKKIRKSLLLFLYLISSYAFLVQWKFQFGSIYDNPFFRFLEFFIGVITVSLCMDKCNEDIKRINLILVFVLFFVMVCAISIGVHCFHIYTVEAYNFIAIPVFGLILYILARIEYKYKIAKFNKLISILSENTYAFFLAQFFTWQPIKIIDNNTEFFKSCRNVKLFLCSLILCFLVTLLLHYSIEKPIKRILSKRIF